MSSISARRRYVTPSVSLNHPTVSHMSTSRGIGSARRTRCESASCEPRDIVFSSLSRAAVKPFSVRSKRSRALSRQHRLSHFSGKARISHYVLGIGRSSISRTVVGPNCLEDFAMSRPCTAKLAHDSLQAGIEAIPLFFKKEIRVDSDELQIILEEAVSFVYPVLPAITSQQTSFVGFFNQRVSSFVSIFFSERFRVAGKGFTGGIRRISARVENTSRAHVFD